MRNAPARFCAATGEAGAAVPGHFAAGMPITGAEDAAADIGKQVLEHTAEGK
jgi:hypothetical protein